MFLIFVITNLIIPNIVYAAENKIELTGIPALIVGLFMFMLPLLIIGAIPAYIIYGLFIRPIILKKKIEKYCKKNNFKFVEKANKLPIENELYTSNIAQINNYYMIEMGKIYDIPYILCHYYPRTGRNAGYRTICVMIKEGINLPHFVLGEHQATRQDIFLLDSLDMKEIPFKEDKNFSNRFFVKSDDSEISNFFNDNIRNTFKKISTRDYYYEGNENVFVVSYSAPSLFEERIKFLEFSLDLFKKLIK